MVKFGGSVVVPAVQYGNLQPSFEVEADTLDSARELWLSEAKALFARFGHVIDDTGDTSRKPGKVYTCIASGAQVTFDKRHHLYGDGKWLSGSTFAARYKPEFPSDLIAKKMAAKTDGAVTAEQIQAMWAKKGEASASYGTGIHAALELYGTYLQTSLAVKGSDVSALHDNPGLTPLVRSFFDGREHETAIYEAFVAEPEQRLCGFIDRLLIVDEKRCRVQDFKTNTSVTAKETILPPFKGVVPSTTLGIYWLQLSFYAHILKAHGWTVDGLDVFHWTGTEWVTYSSEPIDITKGLET